MYNEQMSDGPGSKEFGSKNMDNGDFFSWETLPKIVSKGSAELGFIGMEKEVQEDDTYKVRGLPSGTDVRVKLQNKQLIVTNGSGVPVAVMGFNENEGKLDRYFIPTKDMNKLEDGERSFPSYRIDGGDVLRLVFPKKGDINGNTVIRFTQGKNAGTFRVLVEHKWAGEEIEVNKYI